MHTFFERGNMEPQEREEETLVKNGHILGHSGSNTTRQSAHLKQAALQTVFKREKHETPRGRT